MASRRPARRWAAVVFAFGLAVAATGCGLASEKSPREISDDEVGFDLLSPTTAPPTTLGEEIATTRASLYFSDPEGEVVRPVVREVPEPLNVSTLLRALFDARPTPGDTDRGLTNVITPQTRLLEVSDPTRCRVVIDLASYFPGLSAEEVSYAIAQIVFTLDAFVGDGVEVALLVEGLPEDVRTADGRSLPAVTRDDLVDFDERTAQAGAGEATPTTATATDGEADRAATTTSSPRTSSCRSSTTTTAA